MAAITDTVLQAFEEKLGNSVGFDKSRAVKLVQLLRREQKPKPEEVVEILSALGASDDQD